jgi:hypothetical protein
MDKRLIFILLFLALPLGYQVTLSKNECDWKCEDKLNKINSNDTGFQLGAHEFGICVESVKVQAICDDYGLIKGRPEEDIPDEHNGDAYMEFYKGEYKHTFSFFGTFAIEGCNEFVRHWKKKLNKEKVVCFDADRSANINRESGKLEFYWQLPLQHGWWLYEDPEIPINWADVSPFPHN